MMESVRKISKTYYLRRIVACVLSCWLFFGMSAQVALGSATLGANAHPSVDDYTATRGGTASWDGANTTTLTAPNGSIFNFNNFDIGSAQIVDVSQQADWASLVRVTDGATTGIFGRLNAPGTFVLLNPSGIVFGPSSFINARNFVGSTLRIDDITFENFADGLSDTLNFYTEVGDVGSIINEGTLGSDGLEVGEYLTRSVYLVAKKVLNAGTIVSPGGCVVMAAGDSAVLGRPGSAVVAKIEEMSSVSSTDEGMGDVVNEGTITTKDTQGGEIILAAGDIFSVALDSKVLFGAGRVVQDGTIDADGTAGNGGKITLTSAQETILTSGPDHLTTASGAAGGDSGQIVVHSAGCTEVQSGAQIEATGGFMPEVVEPATDGYPGLSLIKYPSVEISGQTINLAGDIDASATEAGKKGKILVDAETLTIADGALPADPPDNTLYEEWVEGQSQAGVDLELVARSTSYEPIIMVEEIGDGEITGGSGDIYLRTMFDRGGISFVDPVSPEAYEPAELKTNDGGNIFMVAGAEGIVAGDLETDLSSKTGDYDEPGRIRLRTGNGGDIDVGTMHVDGGSTVEISAVASGDLYVDGGAVALTNQVPDLTKEIGFARICLVSENGDVTVDGASVSGQMDTVQVYAHGKEKSRATILICAGEDVELKNLKKNEAVVAEAKLAEKDPANTAKAIVTIAAGGLDEAQLDPPPSSGTGKISINGVEDLQDLAVSVVAKTAGTGTPTIATPDMDQESPDNEDTVTVDLIETTSDGEKEAHLKIDRDFAERDPGSEEPCPDCPCAECPTPPDFPLVPFTNPDSGIQHMGLSIPIDVLANDTPTGELTILGFSQAVDEFGVVVGTVTAGPGEGELTFTPTVDGFVGTATFTYVAIDGGIPITETVTIEVTNALPTASSYAITIHMNTPTSDDVLGGADTPDNTPGVYTPGQIDDLFIELLPDGGTWNPDDSLTTALGGVVTLVDNGDGTFSFTYTPPDGYAESIPDSFSYAVKDNEGVLGEGGTGVITITITNELPLVGGDLGDVHMNENVSGLDLLDYAQDVPDQGIYDSLSIESYDGTGANGGTLEFDITTNSWIYKPKDGYVGPESFNIEVWDGQYAYMDGEKGNKVTVTGTLTVIMTNELPTVGGDLGDVHMNLEVPGLDLLDYAQDVPDQSISDPLSIESYDMIGANGGTLTKDNGTWTYTPKDGYVGPESFNIEVWDGQYNYPTEGDPTKVTVTGTLTLDMTNILPVAEDGSFSGPAGDPIAGGLTFADLPDILADMGLGYGTIDDIKEVTLLDDLGNPVGNVLMLPSGGQVILSGDGKSFTYIPPSDDFVGPDTFAFAVWDGQYDYSGEVPEPVRVQGSVTLNFSITPPPPPVGPAAPLPENVIPQIKGCPVRVKAAAAELGIAEATIEILFENALAVNPDIQPCRTCAQLLDSAMILADQGTYLPALAQVVPEGPITEETMAVIASAMAEYRVNVENPQYALTEQYVDAFANYVAAVVELGAPIADAKAFAMDKYGGALNEPDNAGIRDYIEMRLEGAGME